MKLLYLTSEKGKEPSEALKGRFDSVTVVRADANDSRKNGTPVLQKMAEAGSKNYDPNEFFLFTEEVADVGETLSRKKLNAGIIGGDDLAFYPFFQVDGKHYVPNVRFGDTEIGIVHASHMPYDGDRQKILFVAPHFEEETALIAGLLHKRAGDDIHIMFATNIPNKPGFEDKSMQVYRETLGLTDDEFSFVGIEDMEVEDNKDLFQRTLEERLRSFQPDVVILPPEGANVDHKYVVRYSFPILNESGADVLFGDVVQNRRLQPSVYAVFDKSIMKALLDDYADDRFGNREYTHTVGNILYRKPEGLSRHVGNLIETGNLPREMNVGVFGLQPVKVSKGYRVPTLLDLEKKN